MITSVKVGRYLDDLTHSPICRIMQIIRGGKLSLIDGDLQKFYHKCAKLQSLTYVLDHMIMSSVKADVSINKDS